MKNKQFSSNIFYHREDWGVSSMVDIIALFTNNIHLLWVECVLFLGALPRERAHFTWRVYFTWWPTFIYMLPPLFLFLLSPFLSFLHPFFSPFTRRRRRRDSQSSRVTAPVERIFFPSPAAGISISFQNRKKQDVLPAESLASPLI